MDVECGMKNCIGGKCKPIALGDKIGLKCTLCLEVSKGGSEDFGPKASLALQDQSQLPLQLCVESPFLTTLLL